jgi:hypothetical protein
MDNLDPHSPHMMPAHFGPRPQPPRASGWYRDVTAMVVSYVTDRDKLAAYLPSPFEVGEQAAVSVTYACNRQVDWLAGHGYNMIAVNASARFRGEEEREGNYTLVIWENLTDPILTGRETQGIPKVYADIPVTAHGTPTPAISAINSWILTLAASGSRPRKSFPRTRKWRTQGKTPWPGASCLASSDMAKASARRPSTPRRTF